MKSRLYDNLSLHHQAEQNGRAQRLCVREFVKFTNLFCESKPHRRIWRSYNSASSSVSSVAFISTIFAGNHTFNTNNWPESSIISHRRDEIANMNTKKITKTIRVANKSHAPQRLTVIRGCLNCLSFVGAFIHRLGVSADCDGDSCCQNESTGHDVVWRLSKRQLKERLHLNFLLVQLNRNISWKFPYTFRTQVQ